MTREERIAALNADVSQRILVLDGAMGTEVQALNLSESEFRGDRFAGHSHDLKVNHAILNLTAPEIVQEIHENYFDAGADIVATNTFNASSISQADYGTQDHVYEINRIGAQLARDAAAAATLTINAETRRLAIAARDYKIQRIDGLPSRKVTPNPEDAARIAAERQLMIEARVEFLDPYGHTCKAFGQIEIALHDADPEQFNASQVGTWPEDLTDLELNEIYFDDVTGTSLLRLEINEDMEVPQQALLRAAYQSADGRRLQAAYVIRN